MAGTITFTHSKSDGKGIIVATATADASDGSFPATALPGFTGRLLSLQTNPGSVAPTDDYDITLIDEDGLDRLGGDGVNRDTTNSERTDISAAPMCFNEPLLLTITNNAVNSATTVIKFYYDSAAGGGGGSAGGGDASAANQTTMIGHLDGVEGLLTTIDADTGSILTSVQTLDNAISGNEMQVDVLSDIPGTGATNSGKAVDAVAGATDTGSASLAVRDDSLSTLTPAEGDYVNLRTSSTGALWVAPVDGVVPLAGSSNLGKAVDAVAGASDVGVAILAVRDDSLTTLTPADGDYVPLRTDASGALHVNAGAGSAQYSEDAQHASGDAGDFVLTVRKNSPASTAASDDDYAAFTSDASGNLRVVSSATTATTSNVNDSATNVTLLASNTARKGATFYNDSTQVLYLKLSATATTTSFTTKVQPDQLYELPGPTVYTGIVDGIWAADASGACRVTEIT